MRPCQVKNKKTRLYKKTQNEEKTHTYALKDTRTRKKAHLREREVLCAGLSGIIKKYS